MPQRQRWAWAVEQAGAAQIVRRYRRLWQIEGCFLTNKQDLKIRPIFHWTAHRIRVHMAIGCRAFCCLQQVRYRLRIKGHAMSAERLRKELHSLQLSILLEGSTGNKYALPSRTSAEAARIYRSVGLSWNEAPFRLDIDCKTRLSNSTE